MLYYPACCWAESDTSGSHLLIILFYYTASAAIDPDHILMILRRILTSMSKLDQGERGSSCATIAPKRDVLHTVLEVSAMSSPLRYPLCPDSTIIVRRQIGGRQWPLRAPSWSCYCIVLC